MQEQSKSRELKITRSIQDRVFLGLVGVVFLPPTGYALYNYCTVDSPVGQSFGERLPRFLAVEVILTVFLISLAALVWSVAAPRWLERYFQRGLWKLLITLASISLVLLVCMIILLGNGF